MLGNHLAANALPLSGKKICENYLLGFCPLGPNCEDYHLKGMLNPEDI